MLLVHPDQGFPPWHASVVSSVWLLRVTIAGDVNFTSSIASNGSSKDVIPLKR
jgi:hypothetical protein